jgi:hypothetical protein
VRFADAMGVKEARGRRRHLGARHAPPRAASETAPLDEVISRALLDMTRQFHVPVAAAYLRVRDERRFAAYGSLPDTSPSMDWSHISSCCRTRRTATIRCWCPISSITRCSVTGRRVGDPRLCRRAAGPPGGGHWGALGVFDAKPLSLAPDDIDALAAFARDVAVEIDQQFGGAARSRRRALDSTNGSRRSSSSRPPIR